MTTPDTPTAKERLVDLTDSTRTVLHVDIEDATLQSRPLAVAERTDDGIFRFLAGRSSTWVRAGDVLLAFVNDGDGHWVSASGVQTVRDDQALKERLWSPLARAWFDGPDDPELVVVEVRVVEYAWWDTASNALMRAAKLVKAAVKGKDDDDAGDRGIERI